MPKNKTTKKIVFATMKTLPRLMKLDPREYVIHAYKVTSSDGTPVYRSRCRTIYKVGMTYAVKRINRNPYQTCGVGLHVATLAWCRAEWVSVMREFQKMFIVEINPRDIGAVPVKYESGSCYGKFRVTRFKVLKQVKWK